LLVLGIDPGSINTGWALLSVVGSKIKYIDSGVLKFNTKKDFLMRMPEMKSSFKALLEKTNPDQLALESLIYVKSPTALMKLAQTRGVLITESIEFVDDKIFEYSPNLVKSTTTGHGHANKESIQKAIKMLLGKSDFATHDESDAVAIALCHVLMRGKNITGGSNKNNKKSGSRSMKASLAHKVNL
tara:strand:- start:74242 stop:74799 length:558 start_codon:yes stop_codon:yes gene_type:complete